MQGILQLGLIGLDCTVGHGKDGVKLRPSLVAVIHQITLAGRTGVMKLDSATGKLAGRKERDARWQERGGRWQERGQERGRTTAPKLIVVASRQSVRREHRLFSLVVRHRRRWSSFSRERWQGRKERDGE